jgi:hypothetical protein
MCSLVQDIRQQVGLLARDLDIAPPPSLQGEQMLLF